MPCTSPFGREEGRMCPGVGDQAATKGSTQNVQDHSVPSALVEPKQARPLVGKAPRPARLTQVPPASLVAMDRFALSELSLEVCAEGPRCVPKFCRMLRTPDLLTGKPRFSVKNRAIFSNEAPVRTRICAINETAFSPIEVLAAPGAAEMTSGWTCCTCVRHSGHQPENIGRQGRYRFTAECLPVRCGLPLRLALGGLAVEGTVKKKCEGRRSIGVASSNRACACGGPQPRFESGGA